MIAAACTAIAILAFGAAVRPRAEVRRPARAARRFQWSAPRIRRRPRTQPVTAAEVAAWCESLARVVRSGSSLATAVRSTDVPPGIAPTVAEVILALDRGSRLTDSLELATSSAHLDLALTVLRACALNGGPPAEPLDRAATTLRARAAASAERQTQSAQAKLSATVMTILPVAMLVLLLVTSATTRSAAANPAGLTAIVVGGLLNICGWRWMRTIISKAGS